MRGWSPGTPGTFVNQVRAEKVEIARLQFHLRALDVVLGGIVIKPPVTHEFSRRLGSRTAGE